MLGYSPAQSSAPERFSPSAAVVAPYHGRGRGPRTPTPAQTVTPTGHVQSFGVTASPELVTNGSILAAGTTTPTPQLFSLGPQFPAIPKAVIENDDFPLDAKRRTTAEVNEIFVDSFRGMWKQHADHERAVQRWYWWYALRTIFSQHGVGFFVTVLCLILTAIDTRQDTNAWRCFGFFVAVSLGFAILEGFFLCARTREAKRRCLSAIEEVTGSDLQQSSSSPGSSSSSSVNVKQRDSPHQHGHHHHHHHHHLRRRGTAFADPIRGMDGLVCGLQGDSYRPNYVLRDGQLQLIPKLLLAKGDVVLDQRTLKFSTFLQSHGCCKLYDVVRIALERSAVLLAPVDIAPPPRLPNMPMEDSDGEEDDASTDESDNEREPRSLDLGGHMPTVPQQMEYFVRRLLFLVWIAALLFFVVFGFVRGAFLGNYVSNVLYFPVLAVLGLLPWNVLIAQRCLVLGANAVFSRHVAALEKQCQSTNLYHEEEAELPTPSLWETMTELIYLLRANYLKRHITIWRSPVETLGTTTVIAPLDNDGILTDMIPVPNRVLLVNPRQPLVEEVQSDSDDELADDAYVSEQSKRRMKQRKKKLRLQFRRKRFQENRFTQLDLCVAGDESLAVAFEDDRLFAEKRPAINSLALCALLHSVHNGSTCPVNLSNATAKKMDRTPLWARCMHWLPRAAGFHDAVAAQYVPVRRLFCLQTQGSTHKLNPQVCMLLLTRGEELHAFTIGTVEMVVGACSTYWTGERLEEFSEDEKKEVKAVGFDQWQNARQFQTIACSHRVVPSRYHRFLIPRNVPAGVVVEDFYVDGKRVTGSADSQPSVSPSGPIAAAVVAAARVGAPTPSGPAAHSPAMSGSGVFPAAPQLSTSLAMAAGTGGGGGTGEAPQELTRPEGTTGQVHLGMDNKEHFEAAPIERRAYSDTDEPEGDDDDDDLFRGDRAGRQRSTALLTTGVILDRLLSSKQAFLGLVGLRDLVRPNVESLLKILSNAGIRFMHFGNGTEQHTKAFGARIGLEAEWNSCISLNDDMVVLDAHSVRAQLPFGIHSIRRHIKFVDRIPLQVSLFSHCKTVSTRSMISILQDNHEVVCVLGSGLNHGGVRAFLQGDIAITTTPSLKSVATEKGDFINREGEGRQYFNTDLQSGTWRTLNNASLLTGSICALRIPPSDSTLTFVASLVREARSLLRAISNCTEFMLQANCMIVLLHGLVLVLGLPPPISAVDTVWFLNVLVPVFAIGVAYRGMSALDVMNHMVSKHCYTTRWEVFRYSTTVFVIRYLPTVIVLVVLYVGSLASVARRSFLQIMWHRDAVTVDAVDAARALVLTAITYFNMFHALTHISRHQQLRLWAPARRTKQKYVYVVFRVRWFVASVVAFIIHFCYLALSSSPIPAIPLGLSLLLGLWPLAIIVEDSFLKAWRWKLFCDRQKFRKLFFGTRLGMHSPTGDYEPESSHSEAGPDSAGPSDAQHVSLTDRINDFVFRFVTVFEGRLEKQCVCCEHLHFPTTANGDGTKGDPHHHRPQSQVVEEELQHHEGHHHHLHRAAALDGVGDTEALHPSA